MGALFIQGLGRLSRELLHLFPFLAGVGQFSPQVIEAILAGLLLIGFLLFEPRGLFGIWIRIRNYWKGWPFRY